MARHSADIAMARSGCFLSARRTMEWGTRVMADDIHSAPEQSGKKGKGSVPIFSEQKMGTDPGARIAAIDVGSNSIRLVVAEVLASGGYRVLDEERENTRLAAAMTKTGRLDPQAADATVNVLRNFLSIAAGYGA